MAALADARMTPAPLDLATLRAVLAASQRLGGMAYVNAAAEALPALLAEIERLRAVKDGAQGAITGLVAAAKPIADGLTAWRIGSARVAVHVSPSARPETVRALGEMAHHGGRRLARDVTLPRGEARVLTAIAQHPDGVTREKLTVLTGYRRSSRDTYLQRLQTRGHVAIDRDHLRVTAPGVAALGADFSPLPTGDRLRAYWLDRLPAGERRVLEVLVQEYPRAVARDTLSERTGYQRSSRDTYLQRLGARRLVELERGAVRASAELFG